MKLTQLRDLIREMINFELDEESKAARDAKAQGLEYFGFGRYGKNGQVTHISQNGNLVAKKQFTPSGPNRAKIGKNATKTARKSTSPVSRFNTSIVDYDPETNRLRSQTAGDNRDFQRNRTKLRTVTGTTNFDDPLLKGKGFTSRGDMGHTDVHTTRNSPFSRSAGRARDQIADKATKAFPQGTERGTKMSIEDFQKKTGITNAELKFSQVWNKKYGESYSRTGFTIQPDKAGVNRGHVIYTGQ